MIFDPVPPELEWIRHFSWLAVVGSTSFENPKWKSLATVAILEAIEEVNPTGIVSGGAEGIDTLGEEVADELWLRKLIHLPRNPQWEPEGYKQRNLWIVRDCHWLLAIRCSKAKTYGSGWTADRAEEAGKLVKRVIL